MTTIKPAAELQAGVALLNATHQMLDATMTSAEYAAIVDGITAEHWAGRPNDAVRAVAYMGLRAVTLLATATDSDVETVLGFLGAEVASLPEA